MKSSHQRATNQQEEGPVVQLVNLKHAETLSAFIDEQPDLKRVVPPSNSSLHFWVENAPQQDPLHPEPAPLTHNTDASS
jgi:hypothetical protein